MKGFLTKSNLLTHTALAGVLTVGFTTAARADLNEWFEVSGMVESRDNYAAQNARGSALGRYQIIARNWEAAGIIESFNGDWDKAVFTKKANEYGIYDVDDLKNTEQGWAVQDKVGRSLATEMWSSISPNAKSRINTTVNGVTLNEAMTLRAAWFLGPDKASKWIENGMTAEALAELDTNGRILAQNATDDEIANLNYQGIVDRSLNETMQEYGDVDISDLTNGNFNPGGVAAKLEDCDQDIKKALVQQANNNVENAVAFVQDDALGYSNVKQEYTEMSCLDFAFKGGFDVLFKVPSFDDISNALEGFACDVMNKMIDDSIGQLNGALTNATSNALGGISGFGPISNLGGVEVSFNPNKEFGQIDAYKESSMVRIDAGDFTFGGGSRNRQKIYGADGAAPNFDLMTTKPGTPNLGTVSGYGLGDLFIKKK